MIKKSLKILLSIIILFSISINQTFALREEIDCGWSATEEGGNTVVRFCAGGFDTQEDLFNHEFKTICVENCSSNWVADKLGQAFVGQIIDVKNSVEDENGQWYSCFEPQGGYSQDVIDVYEQCINPLWAEKMLGNPVCLGALAVGTVGTTTIIGSGGLAGPAVIPFTLKVTSSCVAAMGAQSIYREFADLESQCLPTFQTLVQTDQIGVNVCESSTTFDLSTEISDIPESDQDSPPQSFSLCDQIPKEQTAAITECYKCAGGTPENEGRAGIWTAIGCIDKEPEAIIEKFITVGLGIGGGVALLTFLAAGFIYSTSQGSPEKIKGAKEMMTSSIVGILFIIFSVTILQFIGWSILKIPGFGG